MTEEQVTKALLQYLTDNGWHIVCFDFPQSGTGKILHPDKNNNEKNKDSIIPDIVAVKNDICLFFENKDRFYFPDYVKVNDLIVNNKYSLAISSLLSGYNVRKIYYGIGLPACKHSEKSKEASHMVDFIIGVAENRTTTLLYNNNKIKFGD